MKLISVLALLCAVGLTGCGGGLTVGWDGGWHGNAFRGYHDWNHGAFHGGFHGGGFHRR